MHNHDDDDDTDMRLDMDAVNRAVAKQDFTTLQKMIINTNNVGADIVILLGMLTLHNTMLKALREEVQALRNQKETIQ